MTTTSGVSMTTSTDIWFAGTLMRVLADSASTEGQFTLIEQWAPKGFSPPIHVHQREDQLFYLLDGRLTLRLGEHDRPLEPGETMWLPRGIPHTFRVDSPDARLLEVSTPAGFEQFHLDLSEPARERRIPDPVAVDVALFAATSARYGCDIVGPPMEGTQA